MNLIKSTCGKQFWASEAQDNTIENLVESQKGGCVTVHGYIPSTGYVVKPKVTINAVTLFETGKLYQRKLKALESVDFENAKVQKAIKANEKLSDLDKPTLRILFDVRKQMLVDSMSKTLDGDRSGGHRQGHDRCYAKLGDGIKVNFVTEKVDGIMQPVLLNGYPYVQSIMLSYLEFSKTVLEEGERKVVKSGAPVLMTKAIESALNSKSVGLKTMALKEDNFDSLRIDRKTITPDDVSTKFGDLVTFNK